MEVITDISRFCFEPNAATLGFFDGVHKGHAQLIRAVAASAEKSGLKSAVVTFDKHPRVVLQQDFQPKLITSFDEKIALLGQSGCDYCVVLPFTRELSELSAGQFLKKILSETMHTRTLIVGHDHRFGHNRAEAFGEYKTFGESLGMEIEQMPPYTENGVLVSSSAVRRELQNGDVEQAARLLGHPFLLTGSVVRGAGIGHKIDFPTINVRPDDSRKIVPGNGVYAASVAVGGKTLRGMLNIGIRPTIGGGSVSIECHIFDFNENLYGEKVRLVPMKFIRHEKKFAGLGELSRQLENDRETVLSFFREKENI